MLNFLRRLGSDSIARVRFSDRTDGDALDVRSFATERSRWSTVVQVHGADVVVVESCATGPGIEADAMVTGRPGPILAVRTADCVPIALLGKSAVGAVHAGWRGLEAGVIEAAVRSLCELEGGRASLRALVGPHISAAHYEFGSVELERMEARFGPDVVGHTLEGRPALDLGAAVASEFARLGVVTDHVVARCTAMDGRYFSHRARREAGRMVMLVDICSGDDDVVGPMS